MDLLVPESSRSITELLVLRSAPGRPRHRGILGRDLDRRAESPWLTSSPPRRLEGIPLRPHAPYFPRALQPGRPRFSAIEPRVRIHLREPPETVALGFRGPEPILPKLPRSARVRGGPREIRLWYYGTLRRTGCVRSAASHDRPVDRHRFVDSPCSWTRKARRERGLGASASASSWIACLRRPLGLSPRCPHLQPLRLGQERGGSRPCAGRFQHRSIAASVFFWARSERTRLFCRFRCRWADSSSAFLEDLGGLVVGAALDERGAQQAVLA
jgi:hypothetical protein